MFNNLIKEAAKRGQGRPREDVVLKVRMKPSCLPHLAGLMKMLRKDKDVYRVYTSKKKKYAPLKIYGETVSSIRNKVGYGVRKTPEQSKRLKGLPVGVSGFKKYFVYTHRAAGKRFKSIDAISDKSIKFIKSTG